MRQLILLAAADQRSIAERVSATSGWVKDGLSGFAVTPGRMGLALGLLGLLVGWRRKNRKVVVGSALLCVAGVVAMVLLER